MSPTSRSTKYAVPSSMKSRNSTVNLKLVYEKSAESDAPPCKSQTETHHDVEQNDNQLKISNFSKIEKHPMKIFFDETKNIVEKTHPGGLSTIMSHLLKALMPVTAGSACPSAVAASRSEAEDQDGKIASENFSSFSSLGNGSSTA